MNKLFLLFELGIIVLFLSSIYLIITNMKMTKRIRDLENELLKLKHSIYNEDTNKKAKHMKLFEGDK